MTQKSHTNEIAGGGLTLRHDLTANRINPTALGGR
jgi:hypothetical protein